MKPIVTLCLVLAATLSVKNASADEMFTSEKRGLWLGAESNRRHVDFQSTALPTELPSRHPRDVASRRGVLTMP
jgi:hypothetical protein